jgi:hypothetical protein
MDPGETTGEEVKSQKQRILKKYMECQQNEPRDLSSNCHECGKINGGRPFCRSNLQRLLFINKTDLIA